MRTSAGLGFQIRPPNHGDDPGQHDDPYVLSQMVPIIRSAPMYSGLRPSQRWELEHRIRASWSDPTVVRIIAVLEEDPALIVGFAMGRPSIPLLGYLHVRGSFRGQRLGTALAAIMGVLPGKPAAVEFDTMDLSRPAPKGPFPIGLRQNKNWDLTLVDLRSTS